MARLYHARVHGAHGHFMRFAAVHSEKIGHSRQDRGAGFQGIPHRLKPGVAFRCKGVLLGYLALKQMQLGKIGRKRTERTRHRRAARLQPAFGVESQYQNEPRRVLFRQAE